LDAWNINLNNKLEGAPAWDREPRRARFIAGVVFTPARGVIHPSFPLRGRWERIAVGNEQAPFPPRFVTCYNSSFETRPRRRRCTRAAKAGELVTVGKFFIGEVLGEVLLQNLCPKIGPKIQFGTHSNLNRELRTLFRFARHSNLVPELP
jgi:hypothetical protein